ncbi:MAG: hypothetical protein ACRDNZ_24340 [Streptosporangiaceae bacterium]
MSDRILSVALDPQDAARSGLHRTILASLPARFRAASGTWPAADVVLISGDQPRWQQRAQDAIASGVPAIVLSGFAAMTPEAVTQVASGAADAGVIAAADLAYASVRGWAGAVHALAGDLPSCAVLDSIITAPLPAAGTPEAVALRSALVEQLALLRPLLGETGRLRVVHTAPREYVLAGPQTELAVTLSGALSDAAGHQLDLTLVGARRRWHARFAADALAAPVTISAWDSGGERAWPLAYESGHRSAWLRLHGAVSQSTTRAADLHAAGLCTADQLAADLAAAQAALSQILV